MKHFEIPENLATDNLKTYKGNKCDTLTISYFNMYYLQQQFIIKLTVLTVLTKLFFLRNTVITVCTIL